MKVEMKGSRVTMKIAQCPQCKGMCFLDEVNGLKTAASGVDRQGAGRALQEGRSLYVVRMVDGRPLGLQYASRRILASLDDQTQVYADHPCVPLRRLQALRSEPVAPKCLLGAAGAVRPRGGPSQGSLGDCNGRFCGMCDIPPF